MAFSRIILAVLAAAAFFPRPAGAEASNWMREYVQQRQAKQIARVIGEEAARDFLASKNGRIVGGTVAAAGAWPAQVALLYNRPAQNNFNAQFCGGTLVHARFVVTAAHCSDFVVNKPGSVRVLAGTNTLSGSAGRRAVKKITVHPSWNDVTFDFDIAVWELVSNVPGIVPAPMILPSQQATLAAAGTSAFATGWGATSNNGPSSVKLRQVLVPINSQTACNRWNSYDGELTPRMLCAGSFQGGKDACQGDSGGPLWVRNANGQFKILAGVTSWGYACAARNFPGVYSRLAVLGTWARGVITNSGF